VKKEHSKKLLCIQLLCIGGVGNFPIRPGPTIVCTVDRRFASYNLPTILQV